MSPLVSPVTKFDVATILYSSSSMGMVKGIMFTHCNLTVLAAAYNAVRPTVFIYTMSFSHVFGFTFYFPRV